MVASSQRAGQVLVRRFVELYPEEVAAAVDTVGFREIASLVERQPLEQAVALVQQLRPDVAAEVIEALPEPLFQRIVPGLEPAGAAAAVARLDEEVRSSRLALLEPTVANELRAIMAYPPDTAGGLMDPRVATFRPDSLVRDALTRLRKLRHKRIHQLSVVDGDGRLVGAVPLQELAIAEPRQRLDEVMQREPPAVLATAPQSEVVEVLQRDNLPSVPVVDFHGKLLGVIRQAQLIAAAESEATADIQAMVGASREERALSSVPFAVRKRLPWLQINLLTAFLAAFVVGLFENTIAQFTALAVLLPVVAGQSGNTGAQALAVTMRGLALREIRVRNWLRISGKELLVAVINGIAVALVTSLAVLAWSGSLGLASVIGSAMVLSMIAAGLAGASIPMVLTMLGQDPASAASIILTTITDVVGFLSFLGLATLAAGFL